MGDLVLTFLKLAFVATIQTVALEGIFETKLYQHWFGGGPDDTGSRFFSTWELRPWISNAVGIFLALAFQIQAIHMGLPNDTTANPTLLGQSGAQVDMVLTGLIVGGGTKSVKNLMNNFAALRKDAQEAGN